MSVRIHAIAKEINKTSKEVLEILAGRGYDLKSASSTIDNITAQSLIEEFIPEGEVESPKVEKEISEKVDPAPSEEVKSKSKAPIVKSKADLDREKKEKEEAENAQNQSEDSAMEEGTNSIEETIPSAEKKEGSNIPPSTVMAPAPPPPSNRASAPAPPTAAGKAAVPSPPASSQKDNPADQ